jgi:hypothetical protein
MKNAGAREVPHVLPGTQLGVVSTQSYINIFQFSPVEITKRVKNDCPKSLKFLISLITLPSVSALKKNTAKIEKMKRTSINSRNTFESGPTDSVIVYIKAYRSLFLPASLITLVTLRTLIILAIYGPTDSTSLPSVGVHDIIMSSKDAITMKKSNLFHEVSKYLHE